MNTGPQRMAATVGTFDGVHRGHREVLSCLVERAAACGMRPLAVTFDRHPLQVVAPQRAPLMITTRGERDRLLASCGVEVLEIPFTRELAALSASAWMERLHSLYGTDTIVVGYDNTFGHDGTSLSHSQYRDIGHRLGIDVEEAPCLEGISSSAIRKAVATGRMEEAAAMLGRPFSLEGTVAAGQRIGRTIGFPTANVEPEPYILRPSTGVYAALASIDGSKTPLPAMVNIGQRPTIGPGLPPTVEAHILGFEGDLYGRTLRLDFTQRLRDELHFPSLEALRTQLRLDRQRALDVLRTPSGCAP